MKNLISQVGYNEDLLDLFTEIKQIYELRNIYYEIIINYMDLMNKQGLMHKNNNNPNLRRYYTKLYFEREFYTCKKYIKENDILNMNEKLKESYEKEKPFIARRAASDVHGTASHPVRRSPHRHRRPRPCVCGGQRALRHGQCRPHTVGDRLGLVFRLPRER